MLLDLSCPLELLSYELLHDDRNKVRAYLHLNNLSGHMIERIEGDIRWMDEASGRHISAPFVADQLRCSSKGAFKLQLSTDYLPGADSLELTLNVLVFQGGADWRADPARLIWVEEPLPPTGHELNRLIAAAGQDARCFPLRTHDYWFCVCGRPNQPEVEHCARCEREREHIFAHLIRKQVLSGATARPSSIPDPQIPSFLDREHLQSMQQRKRKLREDLDALQSQYQAQRKLLIRRSAFLIAASLLVMLLVQAFIWLGEKQRAARDIRPPTPIERQATGED